MKKAFLFIFSLFLLLSFQGNNVAIAESNNNSIRLLRISSGQINSFAYLFPINTREFENVEIGSMEIEGFKFFLKSRIDLLQESYKSKAENIEGAEISEVKYYTNYDAIGFEITFQNLTAYNQFFNSEDNTQGDSDTKKEQSGFFVVKTFYEVTFPFSESVVETFDLLYNVTLSSWADTFSIDVQKEDYLKQVFENTTYIYQIISSSKQIYSENMTQNGELYYNTFEKTKEDIAENGKIIFWTQSINRGWWYFFALIFTIVGTIFALFYVKIKNKNKSLQA